LDTRNKILTAAQAVAAVRRLHEEGRSVRLVTGRFDPVLSSHARRLEELRDGSAVLMVVVTEPRQPILAARARAELVAALAVVDYVVLPEKRRLEHLFAQLEAAHVPRQDAVDEEFTRDLIRHVHTRQRAG
jgi:bifunctional ADP-heptose synthase (sugar kinase/adenylyltransferase)